MVRTLSLTGTLTLSLCLGLALPVGASAAGAAPATHGAKSDSKDEGKKAEKTEDKKDDKKDEPEAAPEAAGGGDEGSSEEGEEAPDDIGSEEAGGSMPGRVGGGGSSDIVGGTDLPPTLGEPNVAGTPRVKITLRDGTVHEGKLTHVFKGSDKWNADPQADPKFTINVDVNELQLEWQNVKTVTGRDADPSSDIDCWSNQDAVPLEYECTLAQPTFVKMKKTHQYQGDYKMVDREPFTFVLDGNAEKRAMLYLYKIPMKVADDGTPESEALARLQVALKAVNLKGIRTIAFE
ncbi:hypothetical protein L6R50_22990 [Myxococcota bacterium]|nr:hypothetical protein [Myxococcota bacterium]